MTNGGMGHMADSNKELILKVLRGEKALFGVLVEKYEKAVYAVAYNYLRNAEDARDLAQDVFIKSYNQLETLKDLDKFGPWLSRITSRLAIDRLRVQKKSVSLPDLGPVEESLSYNPGRGAMTTSEKDGLKYKLTIIEQLIVHLPDYYRVAFILKYMEGLSNKEIARFLGVPVSTVEGRLHKAREFIREHMGS
jgi:RNA polymerase sigma-70 factor (ECF subfamily)